nr:protein suppressor of gene silencing 3 [Tanacetum cinerariifolium]
MGYSEGLQVGKDQAQDHKSYAYHTTMSYVILDNARGDRVFFMNITWIKIVLRALGTVEQWLEDIAQKVFSRQQSCYDTRNAMAQHLCGSLMDYQELFFKDHLKVIQDSRTEKEVYFDKLLQEARKRVDQAYSAMDLEKRSRRLKR